MKRWYWWRAKQRALIVTYDLGAYKLTVFWERIIGVRVGNYFIGVIGNQPTQCDLDTNEGQP